MIKPTQYVKIDRDIQADDRNGIRHRILWGLRLLNDPEAFARGGSQLKPGVADTLVKAAEAAGLKLNQREIQWRLQAARAYKSEGQITNVSSRFDDWTALRNAGFPPVSEATESKSADWRSDKERAHAAARHLLDVASAQEAFFPLSQFEPIETTLADLELYMKDQGKINANFQKTYDRRRSYLDKMITVADGDMTTLWRDAHAMLPPEDRVREREEGDEDDGGDG